ncbi:MAG: hypothetical protein RIF33_18440 [Cyclobacteriaceae bacterium]
MKKNLMILFLIVFSLGLVIYTAIKDKEIQYYQIMYDDCNEFYQDYEKAAISVLKEKEDSVNLLLRRIKQLSASESQ